MNDLINAPKTVDATIAETNLRIRRDTDVDFANCGEPFGSITYHGRYTLGTEELSREAIGELALELADDKDAVFLPVYAYVHSGATIRTSRNGNPFSCRWDSGQSGIVYARGAKVRETFQVPAGEPVTDEIKEKARALLETDVRLFDNCLTGDVWGFEIVSREDPDEVVDSCWGFYGDKLDDTGIAEHVADRFTPAEIAAAWNART